MTLNDQAQAVFDFDSARTALGSRQPPRLEGFGLTESEAAAARLRRDRRLSVGVRLALVFSGAAIVYVANSEFNPKSITDWLVALVLTFIIGGSALLVISFPVAFVVERVFDWIDPKAAQLKRFEQATADYRAWEARTERTYWLSLRPLAFEREIAMLYRALGYSAQLTPRSGDKGVDIFLSRGEEVVIVQCKTNAKPVGPGVARELVGTKALISCTRAVLVSRSGFSPGVAEVARNSGIELLDLDSVLRLWRTVPSHPRT